MSCALNRWGKGICPPPKPTNETKEMEEKLKKIKEEREKQDAMWTNNTKETGK